MSVIKLYKTDISPAKNMWVDDVATYLSKVDSKLIENTCQFDKVEMDCEKVLPLTQESLLKQEDGYNYLSVLNSETAYPIYYFIVKYIWSSAGSIKVRLVLDTINTFGHLLSFTNKTTIVRQHMDRFRSTLITLPSGQKSHPRIVDKVDEGITPIKYKKDDIILRDKLDDDFYLMYRNNKDLSPENLDNPVNCFLIGEKSMLVKKAGGSGQVFILKPNDLLAGFNYYINFDENPNARIVTDTPPTDTTLTSTHRVFKIKKVGEVLEVNIFIYKRNGIYWDFVGGESIGSVPGTTFKQLKIYNVKNMYSSSSSPNAYTDILELKDYIAINSGVVGEQRTIPFKNVNRTDPRIIKIIKLPYAPTFLSVNNDGELQFNEYVWKFEEGMLKLIDLSTKFEHSLDHNISFDEELLPPFPNVIGKSVRNDLYESKLYNSAFYLKSIYYDDFHYDFPLEFYKGYGKVNEQSAFINFKPTTTINSNFLFTALFRASAWETLDVYPWRLLVKRNNEISLYNSEYINYIKNGYNYDKKTLKRQTGNNWLNTILQLAGAGLSVASAGATGGLSLVAGVGFITSGVSSIIGNINTSVSAEQNIQQRLESAKNSAINVVGSDDIDLLSDYNKNKLHIVTFEISNLMKKSISDLFYYCGYSHPVQERPHLNTRVHFNYIQCHPDFSFSTITSIKDNFLNDITARFEIGVTKYHYDENLGGLGYDFEQIYENWEVNL